MIRDRIQAGHLLTARLKHLTFENGVVLAIPRGGVPVAAVVAGELNLPLDLLMSKKIGHPLNAEFAIGSVTVQDVILDEGTADFPRSYVDAEIRKIRDSLSKRYASLTNGKTPLTLHGRDVVIIDDGLATGNTMLACVKSVRRQHPHSVTVAVPVASPFALEKISATADRFICLETPALFRAVGECYEDFSEISDESVRELMTASQSHLKNA